MASLRPSLPENHLRIRGLLSKIPKLTVAGFPEDLQTFTLFPELPSELRVKIWGFACYHQRTLLLSNTWQRPIGAEHRESIENNHKVPAVLHTCSESRQEALKCYIICAKRCNIDSDIHSTDGHQSTTTLCSGKKIYVNFEVDRFLRPDRDSIFHPSLEGYQLEAKDLAKIQYLDIEWEASDLNWFGDLELFRTAKVLKQLNFIVTSYRWGKVANENLPNSICREVSMDRFEKKLMDDLTKRRAGNWRTRQAPDETAWDWQLLKGVAASCKWELLLEEFDLFPVAAGEARNYIAAGGCDEGVSGYDDD
jgi:2EXR family